MYNAQDPGPFTPQPLETFGERLRLARKANALSQKQLADLCDIDHTLISHYEAKRKLPSFGVLRSLVEALDVDASFLLGVGT